jgi:hypothetical protein
MPLRSARRTNSAPSGSGMICSTRPRNFRYREGRSGSVIDKATAGCTCLLWAGGGRQPQILTVEPEPSGIHLRPAIGADRDQVRIQRRFHQVCQRLGITCAGDDRSAPMPGDTSHPPTPVGPPVTGRSSHCPHNRLAWPSLRATTAAESGPVVAPSAACADGLGLIASDSKAAGSARRCHSNRNFGCNHEKAGDYYLDESSHLILHYSFHIGSPLRAQTLSSSTN